MLQKMGDPKTRQGRVFNPTKGEKSSKGRGKGRVARQTVTQVRRSRREKAPSQVTTTESHAANLRPQRKLGACLCIHVISTYVTRSGLSARQSSSSAGMRVHLCTIARQRCKWVCALDSLDQSQSMAATLISCTSAHQLPRS